MSKSRRSPSKRRRRSSTQKPDAPKPTGRVAEYGLMVSIVGLGLMGCGVVTVPLTSLLEVFLFFGPLCPIGFLLGIVGVIAHPNWVGRVAVLLGGLGTLALIWIYTQL